MKSFKQLLFLSFLTLSLMMTGCASPAKSQAMTAVKLPTPRSVHESVRVTVKGGGKTNPMWTSQISNDDFRTALMESLRKSALFKLITEEDGSAYRLDVTLESLDQPLVGFDMTVSLLSDWKLVRKLDNEVVWHERVLSKHTATVGDAFAGVTRLRLANEGAARANIEEALGKLAAADY